MISFKVTQQENMDLLPEYKTEFSAAADLKSSEHMVIEGGKKAVLKTGVYIDKISWDKVPDNMIPELQIRARSGLAFKHGITLTNGTGTIDADYPEEICVLLWNTSDELFIVNRGDRIAQILLNLVCRIDGLDVGGKRKGGFGSTGVSDSV